jgi:arylsulfatase A-like enzyme
MKRKIIKRYVAVNQISVIVISMIGLGLLLTYHLKAKKIYRPNILLITVDALRADHLSCYGYERNTSPNIDRLAKEGTVFLNCFSTGPGTVYSFAGLLTGRYLAIGKGYVFLDNILDMKFCTLSEYLKQNGYYTAAFVLNGNLMIGKGFEQGFDYYRDHWDRNNAEEMTEAVLNFLNNYRNKEPFFVWVHYIGVHAPYAFREESFKTFEKDKLYREKDRLLSLCPDIETSPYTSAGHIPRAAFHENRFNLNYYVACYDGNILYADLYLGKLLENTKGNTMIILTADHGESLGEHDYYFSHEENIYDEPLHIPLIIKDNRFFKGGQRISTIASSVDIVPTILSRINPIWYFFNKNKFNGVDLREIPKGDLKRKYIYSYFPWAYSIRDINKNIKYILKKDGEEELYFLPDEYNNHIKGNSLRENSIKTELREALESWFRYYPVRADINAKKKLLDKDTKELLRSLGYLQ